MNILTGFSQIDGIIKGLRPGELTVIAGRPGMGKTTLCWSLATNIKEYGKKVCVVALNEGIIGNCYPNGIDVYNYRYPGLPLVKYFKIIYEYTIPEKKYDVILFTALYPANRKDAFDIYSKLKAFAVAKDVAIVIETAVNKSVERLEDRHPDIEHIEHFATIEEYVDNVLIVYRDGYYNADADNSIFEVIVAKNKAGRLGTAVLKFEVVEVQMTVTTPKITAE